MKWQVAEENVGTICFYERSDAVDPNWINCELDHQQLTEMMEPEPMLS